MDREGGEARDLEAEAALLVPLHTRDHLGTAPHPVVTAPVPRHVPIQHLLPLAVRETAREKEPLAPPPGILAARRAQIHIPYTQSQFSSPPYPSTVWETKK